MGRGRGGGGGGRHRAGVRRSPSAVKVYSGVQAGGSAVAAGGSLRKSSSETDLPERRGRRWDSDSDEEGGEDIWVVADPCSPEFGQVFADAKAIAETGVSCGEYCVVPRARSAQLSKSANRERKEAILLQRTASRARFRSQFYSQAQPQMAALEAMMRLKTPADADTRTDERREALSHWDIVATRPALRAERVLVSVLVFSLLAVAAGATYDDGNVSILAPMLVTLLYPIGLYFVSRFMHDRQPAGGYVFELLLVFDVYHLASSLVMFAAVIVEARELHMLLPPVGHSADISSPTLRLLIWWHYCNRIFELLDTIFRITQKKFHAYGALHFYLRLVSVWSWYAATCVGGGDVWFLLVWDSMVVAVRFLVFTLSLLQWNLNFEIDFGLHAPKVKFFRKEHLFRLQACEFIVLLAHASYALVCGNLPRSLMACQILVMCSGLAVFTDFHFSRDAEKRLKVKYLESRLMFSFDSSAWLFLWHFGVAMWIEDHIQKKPEAIGYSGSSGGSLVAGTLASGINAEVLANWVIDNAFPIAGRRPYLLLGQCELALDTFLPEDAHLTSSDVLRVLLTKVSSSPPFLMGEVVSSFNSWRQLFSVLRASCHIPLVGGFLPYPVPGHGWYYDGLIWASLFVPWRTFSENDCVIKCSAYGAPGADMSPSCHIPFWWAIFPPSQEVLRGLMAMGYQDAALYFNRNDTECRKLGLLRAHARPQAH